jgi:hypothetical protein
MGYSWDRFIFGHLDLIDKKLKLKPVKIFFGLYYKTLYG